MVTGHIDTCIKFKPQTTVSGKLPVYIFYEEHIPDMNQKNIKNKTIVFSFRPVALRTASTNNTSDFWDSIADDLMPGLNLKGIAMTKSAQYRRLKSEWRNNVLLKRSRIQGLGLYANRDVEANTFVIEYIGSIIRNEVANKRERIYERGNRGVYMFRVDTDKVVDATLTGGPARYINHSCLVSIFFLFVYLISFLLKC